MTLFEYSLNGAPPYILIQKVSPYDNTPLSWVKVEYKRNEYHKIIGIKLTTSDKKELVYETFNPSFYKNSSGLKSVQGENLPIQEFHYLEHKTEGENKVSLLKKITRGKDTFKITYILPTYTHDNYFNYTKVTYDTYASYKVKEIYKNGALQASFKYGDNNTIVTDCNGITTKFFYSHKALDKIERYDRLGKIYSTEIFTWNSVEELFSSNGLAYKKSRVIEFTDSMYDTQSSLRKRELYNGTGALLLTKEYEYDAYGNLICIKEVGSLKKTFAYDINNLPISCTINGRTSFNTYDQKGNLLTEVNYKGAITSYEYDEFSRCIKKILPQVEIDQELCCPCYQQEYDIFGNITKTISPSGNTTTTAYNIDRKPKDLFFPNGSSIHHRYNALGNLAQSTLQDGSKIILTYDEYGRCLSKTIGAHEEYWEYDGILLKSYTNQRGLITSYEYDAYGRKVAENFEGRRKTFTYDEMGNMCRTQMGALETSSTFDIEGREIETMQNGFHHIRYEYNAEGKKVTALKDTSQGIATDQFFYDEEGNFCKHRGPTGDETTYIVTDWTRTEIDPLGNKKIEVFDKQDRVIEIKKLSPDDDVLFNELIYYDLDGNIKKKITAGLEVEFSYNNMGKVIKEIESCTKFTAYQYDEKSRVIEKTLPNGTIFTYGYDYLDRKIWMKSSDGTTDYEYFYDHLDLIEIKDLIAGKSLQRRYTKYGELCEEIGFFGFSTRWLYDTYGRKKSVILPDESSITYDYDKSCMVRVSRYDKDGKEIYHHAYTKFDVNQHVEEELLPMGLGAATSKRNILELPTSLCSPFHKIGQEFNGNHLVSKMVNSLSSNKNKNYDYDPLSQLIKEGDETYKFDSLGNSFEFEINDLNQIISSEEENFSYNKNGNLLSRSGINYEYDALDRLVKIQYASGKNTIFTYDPLSRLVAKDDGEKIFFLYDKDTEIGAISEGGEILELKVLGLGIQGDIGAAIAIEIQNKIFVPLHDLQGNIIALVNPHGEIEETYEISAFGKETNQGAINPWRFSSKRHLEGLVYFGMRFYDPSLKRWLTPDPAGFIDSRNLYLFNLNSPINRLDQFGLYSVDLNWSQGIGTPASRMMSAEEQMYHQSEIDRYESKVQCRAIVFGPKEIIDKISTWANNPIKVLEYITKINANVEKKNIVTLPQNGIHSTFEGLRKIGQANYEQSPNSLTFALYNQSMVETCNTFEKKHPRMASVATSLGFLPYNAFKYGSDICRVAMEHAGYVSNNAITTSHTLTNLTDLMKKNCPNATAVCLPHSEGALTLIRAIGYMPGENKALVKKRCYGFGVAGASPLPDALFKKAHNVYSTYDCITGWNKKNVPGKISIEKLQSRAISYSLTEDHGFLGPTYGHYIKNDLSNYINKNFGGMYEHHTR